MAVEKLENGKIILYELKRSALDLCEYVEIFSALFSKIHYWKLFVPSTRGGYCQS